MADVTKISVEVEAPDLVDAVIKELTKGGILVEVVRCEDCAYAINSKKYDGLLYCEELEQHMSFDEFCSRGERRDK